MDNRRYIKRVWRVPKDRGALDYFATLVVKALVKHGWPAKWVRDFNGVFPDAFTIESVFDGENLPDDFIRAIEIAARITARTYRVQIEMNRNWIALTRPYRVAKGGHFREIKD